MGFILCRRAARLFHPDLNSVNNNSDKGGTLQKDYQINPPIIPFHRMNQNGVDKVRSSYSFSINSSHPNECSESHMDSNHYSHNQQLFYNLSDLFRNVTILPFLIARLLFTLLNSRRSQLFILLVYTKLLISVYCEACDQPIIYESSINSPKRGSFESPNFPDKYPQDIRCTYRFIAMKHERVYIKFEHFNVEGLSPTCKKDFLDIYIEISNKSQDLMDATLLGRFCGHERLNVPNNLVSMHNQIVLDFFSDTNTQKSYNQDDHMGKLGFRGTYEFIDAKPFIPGRSVNNLSPMNCDYEILAVDKTEGIIRSPTYPGLYPNNLSCRYQLRAKPGYRIRLEFLEFDMHSKERACPIDYINIYDGSSSTSPPIGTRFCGTRKGLTIFSTNHDLLFTLHTGGNRPGDSYLGDRAEKENIQRVGFKAQYRFSRDFVTVNEARMSLHIRGTECDMWVKSSGKSVGYISSPGFPQQSVPPNTICIYYLFGIHNRQSRESVVVDFVYFNIHEGSNKGCTRGSLSAHSGKIKTEPTIRGGSEIDILPRPERVLCGRHSNLQLVSSSPVYVLILNATNADPKGLPGFNATYIFKKDFGIQGKMIKQGVCHFVYDSSTGVSEGYINSPFHDRPYPDNSTCQYDFLIKPQESVRLTFIAFHMVEPLPSVSSLYHSQRGDCTKDYINLFEVDDKNVEHKTINYCGNIIPGPMLTHHLTKKLILRFYSDASKATTGFKAQYEFLRKKNPLAGSCGGNVTSDNRGGVIISPNFPRYSKDLSCEWHIYARNIHNKIMLNFEEFDLEGSLSQGCQNTIVKIYDGNRFKPSSELCGTASAIPSYISKGPFLRLQFIVSKLSDSGRGFRIVWTELLQTLAQKRCTGFKCRHSNHCIDRKLECNKLSNCGTYIVAKKMGVDNSDEEVNCPVSASYNLLHVGLGIILTVLFLIVIVISILYREHRRTKKKHNDPLNEIHATKQLMPTDQMDHVFHLTPPYPSLPLPVRNGATSSTPSVTGTLVREKMQKISIV